MAEVEIAGAKIKGGKLLLVLPVLGTLAGGLWAGFEFYKDYMDMKEVIANIDVDAIKAENKVLETIEKRVKGIQDSTREMIDKENDRNDKIRARIQNRMDSIDDTLTKKMNELNNDVNDKIKKALNNPLSSMRK